MFHCPGRIEIDGSPINLNYTLRGHTGMSRSKGADLAPGYSWKCAECQSDKCNTLTKEHFGDHFGSTITSNESDSYKLESHDVTKHPNSGDTGKFFEKSKRLRLVIQGQNSKKNTRQVNRCQKELN